MTAEQKKDARILVVVGARPNFMKAAPLLDALKKSGGNEARLVHTGQHFDDNMSKVFFEQLGMPEPELYLDINMETHTQQVAKVMQALEKEFRAWKPTIVVVVGDVNSTVAAGLTAVQMGIKLAHVEAGLRSFDLSMPEEINRMIVDRIAHFLFTPSPDGDENLKKEGVDESKIFRVGNIMVDSLVKFRALAEKMAVWQKYKLASKKYGVVTLHRPSNVDQKETLAGIVAALKEVQKGTGLLFPVHPRTRAKLEEFSLWKTLEETKGLILTEPLGYLELLSLMTNARIVITDSGGLQEETTVLGIPCLTVRENTERPITLTEGTNRLVGSSCEGILKGYDEAVKNGRSHAKCPDLWDGKTAGRIAEILKKS